MKRDDLDELRPEYRREDLAAGVRGKGWEALRAGTNLVLTLQRHFPRTSR